MFASFSKSAHHTITWYLIENVDVSIIYMPFETFSTYIDYVMI